MKGHSLYYKTSDKAEGIGKCWGGFNVVMVLRNNNSNIETNLFVRYVICDEFSLCYRSGGALFTCWLYALNCK